MLQRSVLLLANFIIVSVVLVHAQTAPEPFSLEPGKSVEQVIAGGESHTYQINLAAGQFVRFRLAQRAIDGVLTLTSPDGKQLVEMDVTGAGDEESLSLEVATAPTRKIQVGKGGKRSPGRLSKVVLSAPPLRFEQILFELKRGRTTVQ